MSKSRAILGKGTVALVLVAVLGVFVLSLAALRFGSGDGHQARTVTASQTTESSPSLPQIPICSDKGETSSQIEITLEGSLAAFPLDCYYAPADQAFQIVFTNDLKAENSGVGVRVNISIYASQSEAVSLVDGGIQVKQSRAIFAGPFVTGPDSITYAIPPLAAGSYYMQSDSAAMLLFASLILVP